MSMVHLRINGSYWQAWWRDAGGRKRGRGLGRRDRVSKREAEAKCRELERELLLNPAAFEGEKAPTLSLWHARYRTLRAGLSESSLGLVDEVVASMRRAWGDVRIDRISRAMAADWRAGLQRRGLSDHTVCKYVRTAKTLFGERHGARKYDLIPINPFDRECGTAPESDRKDVTLCREQIDMLLGAAPDPEWRALIGLCALAGLRRGEALALRWEDVLWEQGRLVVRSQKRTGRKGKRREVLVEGELEGILLAAWEAGEARPAAVDSSNLHRDILKLMRDAGLQPWPSPFHALRRWRAQTWKMRYPEYVVDAWLGHSLEVSRKHYMGVPESFYENAEKNPQVYP